MPSGTGLPRSSPGGSAVDLAAPGRARDLHGLPPAYIDCGTAEVFRDEDVAFATRIWAAGGTAELHLCSGGFHGFDGLVPESPLSQASVATRTAWVDRLLRGR